MGSYWVSNLIWLNILNISGFLGKKSYPQRQVLYVLGVMIDLGLGAT